MNGRTHAMIGAGSMAATPVMGMDPATTLILMGMAAGAALGPDIDHPTSTISNAYPKVVHHAAHAMSGLIHSATSTGRDRSSAAWQAGRGEDPVHRSVTHTVLSTAFVGFGAWALASVESGTGVIMILCAIPCVRLFRPLWPVMVGLCVLSFLHPVDPVLAAYGVGVGWISHILADGCTKMGVPLLWPVRIKGKRWYRMKFLGSRLASGDPAEWIPAVGVTVVMNFPVAFF